MDVKDMRINIHQDPPGYIIRDILTGLGFTYDQFAAMMGWNREEVISLLTGEKELDEETAEKLEKVFHVKKAQWLTLERQYRQGK